MICFVKSLETAAETWNKAGPCSTKDPRPGYCPLQALRQGVWILLRNNLIWAGGRIQALMDPYWAWTVHITNLQQEYIQLSHLSSQGQWMSQDMIRVVPSHLLCNSVEGQHIHYRHVQTYRCPPHLANIAMPAGMHTVDPTIPVKLHWCWKNLFH